VLSPTIASERFILAALIADCADRLAVFEPANKAMSFDPFLHLVVLHGLHHELRHYGAGGKSALSIDAGSIVRRCRATPAKSRCGWCCVMTDDIWLTGSPYRSDAVEAELCLGVSPIVKGSSRIEHGIYRGVAPGHAVEMPGSLFTQRGLQCKARVVSRSRGSREAGGYRGWCCGRWG